MALVSLIIPIREGIDDPGERIAAIHAALEGEGHRLELLVAGSDEQAFRATTWPASTTWVDVPDRGLAPAALEGLHRASGEVLIVLDLDRPYTPSDVSRVVDCLVAGRAAVAIASRYGADRKGWRRQVGRVLRRLMGTSDPLAGLIGLTRAAYLDALPRFSAVGSKFSLELFAKVRGRWRDVPVRVKGQRRLPRLDWDDVRHLKRLADHRFGNVSRLVQFCAVGASGMFVDLASYAIFQALLARTPLADQSAPLVGPLNLAVAGLLAVSVALVWNFTFNRRLTFNDAREGSAFRQFLTYLLSNAISVPLSLLLRLQLPQQVAFFSNHKLAAAVVGIIAGTAISFSMARWLVFRKNVPTDSATPLPRRRPKEMPELTMPSLAIQGDPPSRPSWFSA